jgi:hypothetical protein
MRKRKGPTDSRGLCSVPEVLRFGFRKKYCCVSKKKSDTGGITLLAILANHLGRSPAALPVRE